jgi:hypothetical protein
MTTVCRLYEHAIFSEINPTVRRLIDQRPVTLTILGRKAALPNFYPKHAYEDTFVLVAKHA